MERQGEFFIRFFALICLDWTNRPGVLTLDAHRVGVVQLCRDTDLFHLKVCIWENRSALCSIPHDCVTITAEDNEHKSPLTGCTLHVKSRTSEVLTSGVSLSKKNKKVNLHCFTWVYRS